MTTQDRTESRREQELARLAERRAWAEQLGGAERVARHHAKGWLTARERILELLDPGSFMEVGMLAHAETEEHADRTPGDGVITGFGKINGRIVSVQANDATVLGGSNGMEAAARKTSRVTAMATEKGYPLIQLSQGGGGRIGNLMGWQMARTGSGRGGPGGSYRSNDPRYRVPIVTAVLGNSYGGASFRVGVSDFSAMSADSTFSISSPSLVEVATGEKVTAQDMGSAEIHSKVTGLIDAVGEDERATLKLLRDFVDYVPLSALKPLPIRTPDDPIDRPAEQLRTIVPEKMNRAFDMHRVVEAIVDHGVFLEMKPTFGRSLITGMARLGGVPVGIIGNNSMFKAGSLDREAATKMARFLEMTATFKIPVIFLHDVPGVLIGREQEHSGIIEEVMRVMVALSNHPAPRLSVIVRKTYGQAYLVMSGGHPFTFAWPSARIGFMAPDAGIRIAYGHELSEVGNNDRELQARYADLLDQWDRDSEPWGAAGAAYIDDVIDPAETRFRLYQALEVALGSGV